MGCTNYFGLFIATAILFTSASAFAREEEYVPDGRYTNGDDRGDAVGQDADSRRQRYLQQDLSPPDPASLPQPLPLSQVPPSPSPRPPSPLIPAPEALKSPIFSPVSQSQLRPSPQPSSQRPPPRPTSPPRSPPRPPSPPRSPPRPPSPHRSPPRPRPPPKAPPRPPSPHRSPPRPPSPHNRSPRPPVPSSRTAPPPTPNPTRPIPLPLTLTPPAPSPRLQPPAGTPPSPTPHPPSLSPSPPSPFTHPAPDQTPPTPSPPSPAQPPSPRPQRSPPQPEQPRRPRRRPDQRTNRNKPRSPPPPPSPFPPPRPPPGPSPPPRPPRAPPSLLPNFVIILSDDQDDLLNSTHPYYMPALDEHLGKGGVRLTDFTVSTPLCCPARTTLLTGQYAHCTNVTGNKYPAGAFRKFMEQNIDVAYLPTWLQNAGYKTGLIGKFLNGYLDGDAPRSPRWPKGWSHFDALDDASVFRLFDPCFVLNGGKKECFTADQDYHQSDIIRDKAIALLRSWADDPSPETRGAPFFLYLAPTAPHAEMKWPGTGAVFHAPRPASRHANLYKNENITVPVFPNWSVRRPNLRASRDESELDPAESSKESDTKVYLQRLRSVRSIDEMLDAVVKELADQGLLDNTYVIYASDNGYHLGSFGLPPGKAKPIEEDMHVPFYIRGPGIPAGEVLPYPGGFIDVVPTLLAMAGLPIPSSVNGLPLPFAPQLLPVLTQQLLATLPQGSAAQVAALAAGPVALQWWRRDALLAEYWSAGSPTMATRRARRGAHPEHKVLRLCTDFKVFPDSGVAPGQPTRIAGQPPGWACYKYIAWCSEQAREFYDLSTDPYEIKNRFGDVPRRLMDRFDGILSALAHCQGVACRNPYAVLHPGQPVFNLTGASDPQYDNLYHRLPRFEYDECSGTYEPETELTWTGAKDEF